MKVPVRIMYLRRKEVAPPGMPEAQQSVYQYRGSLSLLLDRLGRRGGLGIDRHLVEPRLLDLAELGLGDVPVDHQRTHVPEQDGYRHALGQRAHQPDKGNENAYSKPIDPLPSSGHRTRGPVCRHEEGAQPDATSEQLVQRMVPRHQHDEDEGGEYADRYAPVD